MTLRVSRPPSSGAKTLYIDIECSPNIADVWGLFKQNVGLAQLRQSSRMIGFAYRWNNMSKARWVGENTAERNEMLRAARSLYEQADIVVHYNGDGFDTKVLSFEWAREGLTPPAMPLSIDLYKIVRKHFRPPSKKLAYIAQELIGDTKVQTGGHELWRRCLDDDVDPVDKARAWREMAKYCKQDVDLLVPLHEKLRPWQPTNVNVALIEGHGDDVMACPKCASTDLAKNGHSYSSVGKFPRYRCSSCGATCGVRSAVLRSALK